MKKLICAALVIVLATSTLTGCRRKSAGDAGNTSGDSGPGYTITDGTIIGGQAQPTAIAPDANMPTAEPVGAPIEETLPPKEVAVIEAEREDEAAEQGLDLPEPATPEPTDDTTEPEMPGMGAYVEPQDSLVSTPALIDVSSYQFNAVMDDNVDVIFNYPSHWQSVPGVFTVCFREVRDDGGFPARVSVTRKKLVHTPDDQAVMDQMVGFMKYVYKQYDTETFQTSTPDTEATLMGKPALSNTYLAYWGDIEVKGFVIGCAVKRTLYVFHFCAAYDDYLALQNVMQYMVNSLQLKNPEEDK